MIKKIRFEWEQIDERTARAKVIGGWIVHATMGSTKAMATSMVFVQDRDHEWMILPPVKEETSAKKAVSASDFESPK